MPRTFSIVSDVSYGDRPAQVMDIYTPRKASRAPIIFFVHGGAWMLGDKTSDGIITKAERWCGMGAIVTSMNYRMHPTNVLDEVADVMSALTHIRDNAAAYGGDASRILLMGHSAGAHLVSLASVIGAAPMILGTVSLDSAAYNINEIMAAPHEAFYDTVFGTDQSYWTECSPYWRIQAAPKPMLLVASTLRDAAVEQAASFGAKVQTFPGSEVTVQSYPRTHESLNQDLGIPSIYTMNVENWMRDHNALD